MPVTFPCGCGKTLRVPDGQAGKVGPLPGVPRNRRRPRGRARHSVRGGRGRTPTASQAAGAGRVGAGPPGRRRTPAPSAYPPRWFVVGVMNDILFYYPPVLFILGMIGRIRGLVGANDD